METALDQKVINAITELLNLTEQPVYVVRKDGHTVIGILNQLNEQDIDTEIDAEDLKTT